MSPSRFQFDLLPLFMALVAFCFSMTIGVLWEFIEYAADRLFLMDMLDYIRLQSASFEERN